MTKYEPALAAEAAELAKAGALDRKIAEALGVSLTSFHRWKRKHPDFKAALKRSKAVANQEVENALFQKATGYSFDAERIVTTRDEVHRVQVVEHVPPDTRAASWFLANRDPKRWALSPRGARKALNFGTLDGSAKSIAEAGVNVLRLMAAGELAVEEGQAAAQVLAAVSRSLEIGALEERIKQLEGYQAPKQLTHDKKGGDGDAGA